MQTGSDPDHVSLVGPTTGLRLVGVYAALVGRDTRHGLWGVSHWPPPGELLHPLALVPVPPNSPDQSSGSVQLMLELSLDRPGAATFLSVTLEYHIGSAHYHAVIPEGFRMCYPASRYKNSCDPPLPSQLGS